MSNVFAAIVAVMPISSRSSRVRTDNESSNFAMGCRVVALVRGYSVPGAVRHQPVGVMVDETAGAADFIILMGGMLRHSILYYLSHRRALELEHSAIPHNRTPLLAADLSQTIKLLAREQSRRHYQRYHHRHRMPNNSVKGSKVEVRAM